MNNKEFIGKLAQRSGMTAAESSAAIEQLVGVMTERLLDGDQINISGFGVFEAKVKKERLSVNPKTRRRTLIPPKIVPSFRPSLKVKDKFKESEE